MVEPGWRLRMRRLATVGLVLVALMQAFFFLSGSDRPFPYRELQIVSVAATLAMAYAIARGTTFPFAVGAGVNLVTRALQPVLGLTRLPFWANALLMLGWAWALAESARGRTPRAALWILALAHFVSALTASGRFSSLAALMLGAIGLLLAAPNLSAWPGTPKGRIG